MQVAPRISQATALPPSGDFASLLATATAHIQAMSGAHWTDYNEHDPGVTILESLCYALSDIAYRTHHPMADILASSGRAHGVTARQQALFPPEEVFTTAPVTPRDLEQFLTARIPAIRSAVLHPVAGRAGHYDIRAEPYAQITSGIDMATLHSTIVALVAANRPLGIAIDSIRFTAQETYVIAGQIDISADAPAEQILAEALYAAMALDDPAPPQAAPLGAAQQLDPAQIYDGPVPHAYAPHSFAPRSFTGGAASPEFAKGIAGSAGQPAMQPPVRSLTTGALRAAFQAIRGVTHVGALRLFEGRASGARRGIRAALFDEAGERISVLAESRPTPQAAAGPAVHDAPARPLRLIPSLEEQDLKRLHLMRNGARVTVDAAVVNDILIKTEADRRWASRFDQSALQTRQDADMPRGNADRQLARYRSLQFLFPQIYGLGQFGPDLSNLPSGSASAGSGSGSGDKASAVARSAEVLQLKAYLALFEQVLADELAQLNAMALLFSSKAHAQSYFTQPLAHDPPHPGDAHDIARVLGADGPAGWLAQYQKNLTRITAESDPFHDRNNRALGHMLARFGLRFQDARLLRQYEAENLTPDKAAEALVLQKRGYLAGLPELGHQRGLGPDLARGQARSALETSVRLQTGMSDNMLFVEHAQLHLPDAPPDPMQCLRIDLGGVALHLVLERPVPAATLEQVNALLPPALQPRPATSTRQADATSATAQTQHWPKGISARVLPDYSVVLVLRIAGLPPMIMAERFASVAEARAVLLRMQASPPTASPARFPVDFAGAYVSVILPHGNGASRASRPEFRGFVEQTLLDNLPAHLGVQCLWVDQGSFDALSSAYLGGIGGAGDPALLRRIEAGFCAAFFAQCQGLDLGDTQAGAP